MAAKRTTKKTSRSTKASRRPAARKGAKPATGENTATAPVLLSGGNPQVAKADGDAPVQQFLDAMPGWKQRVGRKLDEFITRTVPGVRKAVRWNSPFYGLEGQGWFVSYHCITRYVKVTFFRGTSMHPVPPVASKHPEVRYAHVHEDDVIDDALWTEWIRQAAALPGEPLF